jgi:hypothetical protein
LRSFALLVYGTDRDIASGAENVTNPEAILIYTSSGLPVYGQVIPTASGAVTNTSLM